MTIALLLIDIQNAIVAGKASPERQPAVEAALEAMVKRLGKVLYKARAAHIPVIVIQHDGGEDHRLAKGSEGWELRPELAPLSSEMLIHKAYSDAFFETTLSAFLSRKFVERLVIGGCMTQFCVDTTVRSAVAHGYDVTLLSDGHTTGDNGILGFEDIIAHHNATLDGFDAGDRDVRLMACDEMEF